MIGKPQSENVTDLAVRNDDPGTNMMEVIARAAADPKVDPAKMADLLALHQKMRDEDARIQYVRAFAEMQPGIPPIQKRGSIVIRGTKQSDYGKWEDINKVIKPILSEHGFVLNFKTTPGEGEIAVTAIVSHVSGHTEACGMLLPYDESGSKNAVQSRGSTISYGKRYTASALLNLVFEGEDDDGQSGGQAKRISDEQCQELLALAEEVGADKAKFCTHIKVASFADIAEKNYAKAKKELLLKDKAKEEKIANKEELEA